jgi:poly-gamma-glutamate synthesis protein (capsule biosynthesis protein)
LTERNGLRIAFLGYASVFPKGQEAGIGKPGIAPLRANNIWRDSLPDYYQPGCAPHLTCVPDENDLARLTEDLRRARASADIVVASFHWGDYSRPFYVSEHEKTTARHCIDHGADMVIGHHQHTIRGMEWYKGRPILYGLGHFVLDMHFTPSAKMAQQFAHPDYEDTTYEMGPRKGWPLLPLHKDTRMTLLAWAKASKSGISDIGFLPCRLRPDGTVYPVPIDSAEGREVIEYLERGIVSQQLNGAVSRENAVTLGGFESLRIVPAVEVEKACA